MKKGLQKVTWVVIVVMIGILGLTVAATASDINWPWSSKPGFEPQTLKNSDAAANRLDEGGTGEVVIQTGAIDPSAEGEVIGGQTQAKNAELQPDDNGYTGAVIEANQAAIAPSGDLLAEKVNWDAIIPENAPDRVNTDSDPNWSTNFYYYHVTGTALHPRDSAVAWDSDGTGGCLYQVSGDVNTIYLIHLEIPEGARIDYLRLYYYDTSSNNSYAWVTRYDDEGGILDVTAVTSADATGYGTTLSPLVSHIVDNTNYSYVLNWRPYVNGTSMRLCGLRVAYRLP